MAKPRCVVCNKKIKMMCQQMTPYCCGQCQDKGEGKK